VAFVLLNITLGKMLNMQWDISIKRVSTIELYVRIGTLVLLMDDNSVGEEVADRFVMIDRIKEMS